MYTNLILEKHNHKSKLTLFIIKLFAVLFTSVQHPNKK